ncbi:MAG: divalent metal cation transporter [Pirellulaceae bacterium]
MQKPTKKVETNRQLLLDAESRGLASTLGVYVRLSGPGWLQSAITLGGGSLAGALFLGILGGTNLLWLQMVAIIMGVIMLSAISYVTLSTGERPFRAINSHINPALGWGWIIATCMANMIWCMPQFSLCYEALHKNLAAGAVGTSLTAKLGVSAMILVATGFVVMLNSRQGAAAKAFDLFLKALIGMIVICFFAVVIYLASNDMLNWGAILAGFIPDLRQWNQPTGEVAGVLATLPDNVQQFWSTKLVTEQRAVMIGAAATAVGINMTFLLPYSMLNRGWDKPFRGLAKFDLSTGMAIPYVLVTSCVVIAAAATFHAKIDDNFRSTDPAVMQTSPIYKSAEKLLIARAQLEMGEESFNALGDDERAAAIAGLSDADKQVASSLVRRDAFQLSAALAPLLGEQTANLVFGLGVFGMGFSTIIILMLINGFAFCEIIGAPQGGVPHAIGCAVAGISGAIWPLLWDGPAKLWLAILASSFGMMLLPIAYVTFFMMMNSRRLLGDEKPTGGRMVAWNVLMGVSVLGAIVAAGAAIMEKAADPVAGRVVIGIAVVYVILVAIGFLVKKPDSGVRPGEAYAE